MYQLAQVWSLDPAALGGWGDEATHLSFDGRFGWGIMIVAGFLLMIGIGLAIYNVSRWYERNHHPTPSRH